MARFLQDTVKNAMLKPYDPMQDLYKRGIDFLFKQGVAVVIAILFLCVTIAAVRLMWGKMERMERDFHVKMEVNNQQWKLALDTARMDWRLCEEKRETLAVEVATLRAELNKMKSKR